ncbi:germination protein [Lysinibacillus sp. PLM2]|nr:germination protein [Lysinibacillus sp. PLM2]
MNNQKFFFIISSLVILLAGCTGKTEINDLGLVMAVGLDKGEEEGTIQITAQIVRPADARGQTGAPSGQTGEPIWSTTATGDSIFSAIRHLGRHSSRRIYWAHNYIIAINEELAKEGISDIIDFFTRNHQLRMRTLVAVTPDPASELVSTITGIEVVPGQAIDDLFLYNTISSAAPRTEMLDLQKAYLSESTHPVLARLSLNEHGISNKEPSNTPTLKQVELDGNGVFKNDKLIGTISADDTMGLMFFLENVKSSAIVTNCTDDPNETITVEIKSEKFEVTPTYENNQVGFDVQFNTNVQLVEAGCPFSIQNEQQVQKLEEQLEESIKGKIEKVLQLAQEEFKVDILELGNTFNNRYPAEWKEISQNWDSVFAEAKVNTSVDVQITSSALLYRPTQSGKKNEGNQ